MYIDCLFLLIIDFWVISILHFNIFKLWFKFKKTSLIKVYLFLFIIETYILIDYIYIDYFEHQHPFSLENLFSVPVGVSIFYFTIIYRIDKLFHINRLFYYIKNKEKKLVVCGHHPRHTKVFRKI